jgi:hypothetical protein
MSMFKLVVAFVIFSSAYAQEPDSFQQIVAEGAAVKPDAIRAAKDRQRITTVTLRNLGRSSADKVPVTFGQVFKVGDVPRGYSVSVADVSRDVLPTQVDVKARHPDGSLRHGVISVVLPRWEGNAAVDLIKSAEPPVIESATIPNDIDAEVNIDIEGERYSLSILPAIKSSRAKSWLSGAIVTEWPFAVAIKDSTGRSHPHLTVRGNVRKYRTGDLRLDIAIENGWAYAPKPRDYTYDVSVKLGGKMAYEKLNLTHYHLSRWRKVIWSGNDAKVMVGQDPRYLVESRAVPSYDLKVRLEPELLDAYAKQLASPQFEPMGRGSVTLAMPTTGGRAEIGPLPGWAAAHVIAQLPVTWNMIVAMGNLAGSWPIHYRDQKTDLPVTLDDYPYMTLLGRESNAFNATTGRSELFPSCEGRCRSPFSPDSSHQPSFAFLPYLLTGDYFYLEELLFWANWNLLETTPQYRDLAAGLLKSGQVRGQAWGLRTLAQAAYITPDSHPLKRYFVERLLNNLAWYNKTFSQNAATNKFGVMTGGYAFSYFDGTGIAPWQDDFFTWAVGYAWALGFPEALPLLTWKAKFSIGRMIDPDYCWIFAAEYQLRIRASNSSERFFDNFGTVYQNGAGARVNSKGVRLGDVPCGGREMADWLTTSWNDIKPGSGRAVPGEMIGYATSEEGYPAILQAALAVAVDADAPGAVEAWRKFMSRSVLPQYGKGPQFAIAPLRFQAR